ncbi:MULTISPECIES: ABC transporter ATP-binding protein [unclassified Shinella]|uniref:ABC transporter ATP-binding protein n=1 Tax=unclassified Shinella TaxID=2643062 RepID=UPI00225C8245|nr:MULTISPECIES: ABC transporter ATP-binding protein [unclassified Shinella]MCO5139254.1 ABC transporter ATP-binding protein [Shinella sp.]MDC7256017.1 ABC transporter ATP-binding protein [Shinella sp. YE25]CAI0338853.1 Fe(3+) ions import ATP-binding protein FbpC [Rhizobiaceae bacterium]CAK7257281.1 putative ABC transporter ATP-binding protein YdcT [Shinella sp. WSC3-e]
MGIKIENLGVTYGNHRVIEGLSLAIEPGSFFTLLGPSGCGKTTLLRTIAGFIDASAGRILFGGSDVTRLPAHRRNIGMVFQDYALFPDKTVNDNVAYGLRARGEEGATMRRKIGEALERVGLGHLGERHPAALSGGQRQRVALARALVIQPQVLLMDEPLSNLDAKLRLQVRGTITELQREAGITTVFVTHDQEEALAMSDRIGVMKSGKLEQVGTPSQIYRESVSAYVADFVGAANTIEIDAPAGTAGQGTASIRLAGHAMAARVPAPLTGPKAMFVARPEDISLAPRGEGGGNRVAGTVTGRQYLGGKTSYVVEIGEGITLAVETHGDGHDRHVPGAAVDLGFDPQKTLVLAS